MFKKYLGVRVRRPKLVDDLIFYFKSSKWLYFLLKKYQLIPNPAQKLPINPKLYLKLLNIYLNFTQNYPILT